jgi:2-polyprenyl-3-methyl-5-hydroxy-6-metoxy-1,4-benzoquinol methylase
MNTVERALLTGGITTERAVYQVTAELVARRTAPGGRILDVGCGMGNIWSFIQHHFDSYSGADVVQHAPLPGGNDFHLIDTATGAISLPDGYADVVLSLETIEHVENPRSLYRELTRLLKPGGLLVVSTPNQVNLANKLCLLLKDRFVQFQDNSYPSHITALLEVDLIRMARECGLEEIQVDFTGDGRMPGTSKRWPKLSFLRGRLFSDNIIVSSIKPRRTPAVPS